MDEKCKECRFCIPCLNDRDEELHKICILPYEVGVAEHVYATVESDICECFKRRIDDG